MAERPGTLASSGSDAEVAPEKRRSRGAHHKPRRPRKSNPLAVLQPASGVAVRVKEVVTCGWRHEELEFRELSGTKSAKWQTKDTLLLQPGSKTAGVAATFTLHATG